MQSTITQDQIISFILNDVNEEQRNKITEAINTDSVTKEMYLFEKRKYDVERYLDNEMSIGERCEIEELLKTNPRLYDHFDLSKDLNTYLQIEAFKEQLNKIHTELYNSDNSNEPDRIDDEVSLVKDNVPVRKLRHNVFKIGKWVAAASIVIMIGFSEVNTYLNNRDSLENRLYAKYYEPFNNNKNHYYSNSIFLEAKKQYSNKEYDLALMLLDKLPSAVTIESEKLLYQGLTLMELKRYYEAIVKFEQLQETNSYKPIQSTNNWYLSLCYVKTGRNEQAIAQLEKITKENSIFYTQAKKLLKKIKN